MTYTGECAGCHKAAALLFDFAPPYAHKGTVLPPDQPGGKVRTVSPTRPPARQLCADCYNTARQAAEDRLHRAAPDLLSMCQQVLLRLDLEAAEQGPRAVFPCAALRDDLRRTIAAAIDGAENLP